ncbi:MAG: CatA-like O-acetyltransferase [Halopseudomonas aestusnigri]
MSITPNEKLIDLKSWPRRSQYDLFKGFATPHVSITARVDATGIMRAKKDNAVAPFNAMLFCIMSAINTVPELRTRFRKDVNEEPSVIEHVLIHPSVTVPIEDDRFAFCEIPYVADWTEFNNNCESAILAAKSQIKLTENTIDTDHWVFMSCLPWLDFTEMKHPLKGPEDCIPRLAWGKFTSNGTGTTCKDSTIDETWYVSVNLTAHHALADGLHIAQFFKNLELETHRFPKSI